MIRWTDLEYSFHNGMVLFLFREHSKLTAWIEQQQDSQFSVVRRELTDGSFGWVYSTPMMPYWQDMIEEEAED